MNRRLKRRRLRAPEDVSPLEGAVNIVDAMLVFACGLMLAVMLHWNIDLGRAEERLELIQGQEVTQSPEVKSNLIETENEGDLYEKLGTVYKDPATGKLFMLTN